MKLIHDAYDLIGVLPKHSLEEIERAWKKKVRELHPDRFPIAMRKEKQEQLIAVNHAWEKIREEKTRAEQKILEIPVFYTEKIPTIRRLIDSLREDISKQGKKLSLTGLFRGKHRTREIFVLFCGAITVSDRKMQIFFQGPLPKGKNFLVIPEIKCINGTTRIYTSSPKHIPVESDTGHVGSWKGLPEDVLASWNMDEVELVFPSSHYGEHSYITI